MARCASWLYLNMPSAQTIIPYIIGVLLLSTPMLTAQEVDNKAFDLMLRGLLDASVDPVDVKTVHQQLNEVELLDAREWDEYAVSHLPNARYVGYDDFSMDRLKDIDKDTEVVVYCSVGYRSERIGEQLEAAGYSNVRNLYGGIFEWSNAGFPLQSPSGDEVKRLHAYGAVWGIWVDGDQVEKVYSKDE